MHRIAASFLFTVGLIGGPAVSASPPGAAAAKPAPLVAPCQLAGVERELRCGVLHVEENRERPNGRRLPLKVIVIPAKSGNPAPDPVFMLAGGPGQAVTDFATPIAKFAALEDRDLVLVDQRGTGEGHSLDCKADPSGTDLQALLQPFFHDPLRFRTCRQDLERRTDLTQYTTADFIEDLEEVRQALGYQRINLEGASYGTRAAFVYMQMHPERIRSAMLTGIAPLSNRAPLYHAAAAQRAFDLLAEQCAADPACGRAFPAVKEDLAAVIARLRTAPVPVSVRDPVSGNPVELQLTEAAFGDGLRVMLYSAKGGRAIPLLLQRARSGDLTPFAEAAVKSNRGISTGLRQGLNLAVTCTEDVARIRPEEVARETAGSFIGDHRVRGQMAACAEWPRAKLPSGYFDVRPVSVPTLLVSGNLDPVTPPHWGEDMARLLPNNLHIVGPGAHTEMNECLAGIRRQFFSAGKLDGIDPACVAGASLPPFVLSAEELP